MPLFTKEFPSPTGENFFGSVFLIFYGSKNIKEENSGEYIDFPV
jgi:hypothetical protein